MILSSTSDPSPVILSSFFAHLYSFFVMLFFAFFFFYFVLCLVPIVGCVSVLSILD